MIVQPKSKVTIKTNEGKFLRYHVKSLNDFNKLFEHWKRKNVTFLYANFFDKNGIQYASWGSKMGWKF